MAGPFPEMPSRVLHGVGIALYPAREDLGFVVEVAFEDSLNPGNPDATTIEVAGEAPAGATRFIHATPNDGKLRFYRTKHAGDGFDVAASPATPWISRFPYAFPGRGVRPAPVAAKIKEVVSEANNVGTLRLVVDDPQHRIVEVLMAVQSGNAAMGGFSAVTPDGSGDYVQTVSLVEKHPSKIAYRIRQYDESGRLLDSGEAPENVVTFDVGTIPNVADVSVEQDGNGNVDATLIGDSDTQSFKVLVDTVTHTAAEVAASGTVYPIDGSAARSVRVDNITSVAAEQTKLLSVIGYTGANGTGTSGPVFTVAVVGRPPGAVAVITFLQLDEAGLFGNSLAVSVGLDGAQEWRTWERLGGWPTTDGTATGALDPAYARFHGSAQQTNYTHRANIGTWNVIAVPYNAGGVPGERATGTISIDGTATASLFALEAFGVAGIDDKVVLEWAHTSSVNNTDHDLEVYRDGTLLATIDPTLDAYEDLGPEFCAEGTAGCTYQTLTYELKLITTVGGATKRYEVTFSGYMI